MIPVLDALLIGNLQLPFTASWQQIKDYVRQVCDVDHVEIFQKSTSGWVRVNGRENFDAAFSTTSPFFSPSFSPVICLSISLCEMVRLSHISVRQLIAAYVQDT